MYRMSWRKKNRKKEKDEVKRGVREGGIVYFSIARDQNRNKEEIIVYVFDNIANVLYCCISHFPPLWQMIFNNNNW